MGGENQLPQTQSISSISAVLSSPTFLFTYLCVCVSLSANIQCTQAFGYQKKQEEGIGSPRAGVIGSGELSSVGAGNRT